MDTDSFDPEFTSADMRDAGPEGIHDIDEEDPSEDWVALSQSVGAAAVHTPNGPLGSDRPPSTAPLVSAPAASAPAQAKPVQGIDIGGGGGGGGGCRCECVVCLGVDE